MVGYTLVATGFALPGLLDKDTGPLRDTTEPHTSAVWECHIEHVSLFYLGHSEPLVRLHTLEQAKSNMWFTQNI